jgi:hypothetical protein
MQFHFRPCKFELQLRPERAVSLRLPTDRGSAVDWKESLRIPDHPLTSLTETVHFSVTLCLF